MTIEVQIVADSVNSAGERITTMNWLYPRFIHAEVMTHRKFSRNASSSRAIPVKRMISDIWSDPATPVYWGANRAGMQAHAELSGWRKIACRVLWTLSSKLMCGASLAMHLLGLHKQIANRVTEPWQNINVLVTSTEWDNFFKLRCHPDAQPEIQALASQAKLRLSVSLPKPLKDGEWHLPYVSVIGQQKMSKFNAVQVSAARCCRVSYLNHGGLKSDLKEDQGLYNKLVSADPPHMSPVEHQARAMPGGQYANFSGWMSHRYYLENTPKSLLSTGGQGADNDEST